METQKKAVKILMKLRAMLLIIALLTVVLLLATIFITKQVEISEPITVVKLMRTEKKLWGDGTYRSMIVTEFALKITEGKIKEIIIPEGKQLIITNASAYKIGYENGVYTYEFMKIEKLKIQTYNIASFEDDIEYVDRRMPLGSIWRKKMRFKEAANVES